MHQLFLIMGIIDIDWAVFRFINSGISNSLFDQIIPFVRDKWLWLPLYVFVISWMVVQWKKLSWMVIFFFFLTAGASDYISASVIKPLVKRERPCQTGRSSHEINVRVTCGNGYSFPSSHATNHMGMAVYLFLISANLFRKGRYLFFLWAILVSFAQVYVGVHYPSDIFVGWLLGTVIAIGAYSLLKFYFRYFYDTSIAEG